MRKPRRALGNERQQPLPTMRQDVGEAAVTSDIYFYAVGKKKKKKQVFKNRKKTIFCYK
jgi:hypothetical protein